MILIIIFLRISQVNLYNNFGKTLVQLDMVSLQIIAV